MPAFLGGKTQHHYELLILILQAKFLERFQARFAPNRIISDYETGFIRAVQLRLPTTQHFGCFFHFTQCIYRKAQLLGLSKA